MSIHRSRLASGTLSLWLVGLVSGCAGAHPQPQAPAATAASTTTPPQPAGQPPRSPLAQGAEGRASSQAGQPHDGTRRAERDQSGEDDVELVVSSEVVGQCPTLRLVREHVSEFDPDMVWLAVLESIAECMSHGSSMAGQSIGVSGDEEHRHVVRQVLSSRGVAPTRVVARSPVQGVAECQGGASCNKRVEITIVGP